jgi:homoserine acetyltransferase
VQDIAAAAKALRALGKQKIFVVGASMGGLAPSSRART